MIKFSYRKITIIIFSIAAIFSMNPYFIWDDFCNGAFNYLTYLLYIISICLLLRDKRDNRPLNIKLLIGMSLVFFVYLEVYVFIYNESSAISLLSGFLMYMNLILFVQKDARFQKDTLEMFTFLFIVSMIPGLVYYLFDAIGIDLSIGTLYSSNQKMYTSSSEYTGSVGYYKLYIGAVMRINNNTRFSGIYDEAGLIGTLSALLLASRRLDVLHDKKCRWLLFYLILSFSLAGYILAILCLVLKWVRKGQWKLVVLGVLGTILFLIVMNIESSNSLIVSLQNRISIDGFSISITNNRTTSHFEEGFATFLESGIINKLFGLGRGASSSNTYIVGSSSYLCSIYDYGYCGFLLMIATICYIYFFCQSGKSRSILNNWDCIVLLIILIVSIYQRPNVYTIYYFITLFGGCSNLQILIKGEMNYVNKKNTISSSRRRSRAAGGNRTK